MSLLADALKNKLIPWSRQDLSERFIVAREKMSAAQMPDGVTLARRKIVGPRVVVKDRRYYGNTRGLKAHWPEAKLGQWDHYKMVCVLGGKIDFQIGRYAVQCGEGIFLITPPGTIEPIGAYNAKNFICDALTIVLHPHAIQCFIYHHEDAQIEPLCQGNYLFKNEDLALLFDLFMRELLSERNGSTAIASDLLVTFWDVLLRDVQEELYINPGPRGRPVTAPKNRGDFEAELLRYIQSHLGQPLTLENTARGLYLSRTQFVRNMRQETGRTFVQFLTDYRIAEAKALLRDSDWTVSAIAGFLGFNSATYFQILFRQQTGQTPSQYRKNSRRK
jgi:AraC-like DNA-binding protein